MDEYKKDNKIRCPVRCPVDSNMMKALFILTENALADLKHSFINNHFVVYVCPLWLPIVPENWPFGARLDFSHVLKLIHVSKMTTRPYISA